MLTLFKTVKGKMYSSHSEIVHFSFVSEKQINEDTSEAYPWRGVEEFELTLTLFITHRNVTITPTDNFMRF